MSGSGKRKVDVVKGCQGDSVIVEATWDGHGRLKSVENVKG